MAESKQKSKRQNRKSVNIRSRKSSRRSQHKLPKTRKVLSHHSAPRILPSKANSNMSLTDLEFMAKSRGIPFGGVNKSQLIRRINLV